MQNRKDKSPETSYEERLYTLATQIFLHNLSHTSVLSEASETAINTAKVFLSTYEKHGAK